MPHRIRLRKPWTRHDRLCTDTNETSCSRQVDVPDTGDPDTGDPEKRSVASSDAVHRADYCRRFNRPSGLHAGERVELEVGAVSGRLDDVRINSRSIFNDGESTRVHDEKGRESVRFDLTDRLADHNELEIRLLCDGEAPRLVGAVNLWILDDRS
ncbi:hypothetical protein [Aporhodopirellula aestuarii]|uniref:Uncharacterized protein n=1 Tax=Aporhodopirellula aestuarii TaxID=2950107 RepID=A0ABT0UA58_9BACT|nr:hypothetical protein [Aporhodopirellula aestuarii]MCM2373879.1 hypothetical protein [Aporhodopirellula aestuarii]